MAALGITDRRHSYMCNNAHGKTNKWSYRKPIYFDKNEGLSGDDWMGRIAEINQGIYCGLKMGTNYGRMKELLEHNFEYVAPTDFFRPGDFRGYDTAAVPTPTAKIVNNAINYGRTENGIAVEFTYNPNNTTGVNLKPFFESGYATMDGIPHSFDSCYLCILVADSARGSLCYVAMRNYDTGTITPIKYNGSYVKHWRVPLAKGSCPAMFNKSTGSKFIGSVFLVYSLTPADQFNPSSLTQWTEATYDSTANTPRGCIGVFEALGISLTLTNEYEEQERPENKAIITTGISGDINRLYINYTRNDASITAVTVYIDAGGYPYGSYGRYFNLNVTGNSGSWSILWNDLHISDYKNGTVVNVNVQIYQSGNTYVKYFEADHTLTWTYSEDTGLLG